MDDLTLFHVSSRSFQANETIGPFCANTFVPRVSAGDDNVRRMEALFDERRPPGVVPRQRAIFAFDSLAFCADWWEAERQRGRFPDFYSQSPNYYQVRLPSVHRAPFQLTSHALKFVARGTPCEQIVDEYWNPVMPWRIWEFLGDSATVVRRLPAGENDQPGRMIFLLSQDRTMALERWPAPPQPG